MVTLIPNSHPFTLAGIHICLREIRRADGRLLVKWFNDAAVTQYLSSYLPYSEINIDEVITTRHPSSSEIELILEEITTARAIGFCRIYRIDTRNHSAEITCIIGEQEYWNKGYGYEATSLLVEYCFDQLGINRVGADADPFNLTAIRVLEKVGFQQEGFQRQAVCKKGEYHDKVLFGLLKIAFIQNQVMNYYQCLIDISSSWQALEVLFLEFENFLGRLNPHQADEILDDSDIKKYQPAICALRVFYEYEREKYWARRIIQHPKPEASLQAYPNFDRHSASVDYEIKQIRDSMGQITKILFIGGGPLPLTPLFLFRNYKISITILDKAKEACEISREVVRCLHIEQAIQIINEDVIDFTDFGEYDIIWLAMLVGEEKAEKVKIIAQLLKRLQRGQKLVVRNATGFQNLFYSGLKVDDISAFQSKWEMAGSSIVLEKS